MLKKRNLMVCQNPRRQNCVETSTYGSEIMTGHIAVDLAAELRYNLRMLGAPVKGTDVLFGENKKAVDGRIASIVNCDTKNNLTDM
eukprot:5746154-Ditylum_brightwellii.AAC.1